MSPSLGGRRVDRAEEEEEEEDRLQRERVELLQRQLKSEEGETDQGAGMGRTSSYQFGRRSSSARSFGATSPLGSSSPRMSNPIDTMVERLEGGEAIYGAGGAQEGGRVSYFPRLTGPEGLVAGAEVTVSTSLNLDRLSICHRTADQRLLFRSSGGNGRVSPRHPRPRRTSQGRGDFIRSEWRTVRPFEVQLDQPETARLSGSLEGKRRLTGGRRTKRGGERVVGWRADGREEDQLWTRRGGGDAVPLP